ncbi:MAG: hypothetical protein ABSH47_17915 [Bryobacteraceae bacterium]
MSIHRFVFCLLTVTGMASLWAQQSTNTFMTVTTSPSGGTFLVDGQPYVSSAVFSWVIGSKHVIQALQDLAPPGYDPTTIATRANLNEFPSCYRRFSGWTDSSGQVGGVDEASPVITVTADPALSQLVADYIENCMVFIDFYGDNPPAWPNSCDTDPPLPAGSPIPQGIVWASAGLLHKCYWNNVAEYVTIPNPITLAVYPSPGWLFQQWDLPDATLTGPVNTITVGDVGGLPSKFTLTPEFVQGERVRFLTAPPGLQVVVDHVPIPTIREPGATVFSPCAGNEMAPPPVTPFPTAIPRMCYGDYDFLIGSTHSVWVPSPQGDDAGPRWVFNSFTGAVNSAGVYTVPSQPDLVTASFLPAAPISWITVPPGLKLTVDGVSTHSGGGYWGVNSTHSLSAPLQQRDANNKVWDFKSWSDGGGATHNYTVPATAVNGGAQLIATWVYDPAASANSLLTVQSSPPGLTLQVDGQACVTPCITTKPNGTTVRITAPPMLTSGPGTQYLFQSWSDMGAPDHQVKLNIDTTVTADYSTRYLLTASASPTGGGTFIASPFSADGYYNAGAAVTLTARPATDYRFSMWSGGLSGTAATGTLSMQGPVQVAGYFQKLADTPGVFVQNAAGQTPQPVVASGSLVSIFGANLAPSVQVGPTNPVSQTLNGVVVTTSGRILPLMFVSPWQINALLPSGLTPGDYDLTISSLNNPDIQTSFTVARNAPGLLTNPVNNRNFALALHQDGSLVTPSQPALPGETVTVLGTGFGPLTLPYIDGFPAPQLPPNALVDPVSVSLGGTVLTPAWAGAAPGFVGLVSVQFVIGDMVPKGTTLELTATVNGVSSNTVLLPIQ